MRERLHDYLDGELDVSAREAFERELAADPALKAELEALRSLRSELEALPAPQPTADFGDQVMAQLRRVEQAKQGPQAQREQPRRSFWDLFRVSLQVPAWAALLLVLGLGVAFWATTRAPLGQAPVGQAVQPPLASGSGTSIEVPHRVPTPGAIVRQVAHEQSCRPRRVPVRFVLHAPGAKSVSVAGDFNAWRRDRAVLADDNGNGVWTVTVYLTPGRYQYKFVVDGKWVVDPDAPNYIVDGFGGRNAVLSI